MHLIRVMCAQHRSARDPVAPNYFFMSVLTSLIDVGVSLSHLLKSMETALQALAEHHAQQQAQQGTTRKSSRAQTTQAHTVLRRWGNRWPQSYLCSALMSD